MTHITLDWVLTVVLFSSSGLLRKILSDCETLQDSYSNGQVNIRSGSILLN